MRNESLIQKIAARTNINPSGIKAVLELFDQGATIPFIARYRKERTGALDELEIRTIQQEKESILQLDSRKETILHSISQSGNLTPDLQSMIEKAESLTELEDIYLPYKPKRRTRGSIAREKGLEPLAKLIVTGKQIEIMKRAEGLANSLKCNKDEVFAGARDIIAEWMNEDIRIRNACRNIYSSTAVLTSTIPPSKKAEATKYINYNDFSRPLKYVSSHQYLAIMRGEHEGLLKVKIEGDSDRMINAITRNYPTGVSQIILDAAEDCYKRLLRPSLETELRVEKKKEADNEAIRLFSENLEQLLMTSPLGEKELIAIDPGYRTGCKLVCLDSSGKLLEDTVIYPTEPRKETERSETIIKNLVKKYSIKAIAIGDGTAGRETLSFVKSIDFERPIQVFSVN
ncbi:MAG: RNA-binding transcriptional accessory protein, partial [Muribaculaceae bacterium]|nr:RNA-binding transcriptional accessory protein [Muribaculaceae bacterium]